MNDTISNLFKDMELIKNNINTAIFDKYKKSILFAIYNIVDSHNFYDVIEIFFNSLSYKQFIPIKEFVYINGNINNDKLDELIDMLYEELNEYCND